MWSGRRTSVRICYTLLTTTDARASTLLELILKMTRLGDRSLYLKATVAARSQAEGSSQSVDFQ